MEVPECKNVQNVETREEREATILHKVIIENSSSRLRVFQNKLSWNNILAYLQWQPFVHPLSVTYVILLKAAAMVYTVEPGYNSLPTDKRKQLMKISYITGWTFSQFYMDVQNKNFNEIKRLEMWYLISFKKCITLTSWRKTNGRKYIVYSVHWRTDNCKWKCFPCMNKRGHDRLRKLRFIRNQ